MTTPHTNPLAGTGVRGLVAFLAVALLSGLLTLGLETPAEARTETLSAPRAAPPTTHAAAARAQFATGPGIKLGCLGPDVLCDVGGKVAECATDVLGCGGDAAKKTLDSGGKLAKKTLTGAGEALRTRSCGVLDSLCKKVDLPDVPGLSGIPGMPGLDDIAAAAPKAVSAIPGLSGIPNPMSKLGEVIAKAAADAWTAAMLNIWNSSLFITRIVLSFSEWFLTPDLRAEGPGKSAYEVIMWLALSLVVILVMIQLGAAAFKREGKGLARALIGAGQFVVVCACWFGYTVMIVVACGALTHALMSSLLKVNTWAQWDPLGDFTLETGTNAVVATVLAILGVFLWLAAIGHFLVYLGRAGALLVLNATGPLAAAGLVSEYTTSWFWKSLRWFHAAAFTPVLMALVLGLGVQLVTGVAGGLADGAQKAIGTALPAVTILLVSVASPLALFKLFAFADPGTPSGASFRQGMAMQGGLSSLLSGGGGGGGSSAASESDSQGRSSGEGSAESSTGARFGQAASGLAGKLGPAGMAVAAGIGTMSSLGGKATALMGDQSNQSGVGHQTYGPDFSNMGSKGASSPGHPKNGGAGGGGGGRGLHRSGADPDR
ncbi:MAG: type IV secretion system protein, partial [Brachybacterium sp.]|nr:type IV secretion system protein [Brachybacterium sp.]